MNTPYRQTFGYIEILPESNGTHLWLFYCNQ